MQASVLGFILEWFWLAMLLLTVANAWHWQFMGGRLMGPGTHASYLRYAGWYFLWAGIPWIVMGAGILTGDARNLIDFLKPADGQASVIGFYVSRFVADLLAGRWLYFKDGFARMADHPGLFRPAGVFNRPPLLETFYWAWMGLFVTVTLMMLLLDPVPRSWGDAG